MGPDSSSRDLSHADGVKVEGRATSVAFYDAMPCADYGCLGVYDVAFVPLPGERVYLPGVSGKWIVRDRHLTIGEGRDIVGVNLVEVTRPKARWPWARRAVRS